MMRFVFLDSRGRGVPRGRGRRRVFFMDPRGRSATVEFLKSRRASKSLCEGEKKSSKTWF